MFLTTSRPVLSRCYPVPTITSGTLPVMTVKSWRGHLPLQVCDYLTGPAAGFRVVADRLETPTLLCD